MRHLTLPRSGTLRARVFARDHGICARCDHDCTEPGSCPWEVDHRIPRYFGGTSDLDNLQTLCLLCHHRKSRNELRRRKRRALRPQAELRLF